MRLVARSRHPPVNPCATTMPRPERAEGVCAASMRTPSSVRSMTGKFGASGMLPSLWSPVVEAVLGCPDRDLGARAEAKLLHDVGDVPGDRRWTDHQLRRDGPVAQTLGEQPGDLPLAHRQRRVTQLADGRTRQG